MKRILITGRNSYIGNSFADYLDQEYPGKYEISRVSLREDAGQEPSWQETSWAGVDTVLHVAGIAHVDTKTVDQEGEARYYAVNRDLTMRAASKARADGVKQFIFLSSMIVYGKAGRIDENTPLQPLNFYGDSKRQAEEGLQALSDDGFAVAILRPPFVYGKGSKGNYPLLSALAVKTPLFPSIDAKHSMIFVGNLCEFLRLLTESGKGGTYHPQNAEIISTAELVKEIAAVHGHKVHLTGLFNPILHMLMPCSGLVAKVFGEFVYTPELSRYEDMPYQRYSLEESIRLTERNI